ncbi:MAG TPA: hypothetical protein VJQ52_06645 [Steroidobacteraceae bacterium]|nr:hypothetical protein [Steroidobacteraceae bacterium]
MQSKAVTALRSVAAATALSLGLITSVFAHGSHAPNSGKQAEVGPLATLQLEEVRQATARYLDVDAAVADGYVDIGAFVPGMGWHYLKPGNVDSRFNATGPELLVYADDPCGGKRRLVAVEYAVPLELSKRAPQGFVGNADGWDANHELGLWTLHAWIWEYNPDGVFAPFNSRVP